MQLFYVDTGVTDYADVRIICAKSPPMLCAVPQQALKCTLAGVKLVGVYKKKERKSVATASQ